MSGAAFHRDAIADACNSRTRSRGAILFLRSPSSLPQIFDSFLRVKDWLRARGASWCHDSMRQMEFCLWLVGKVEKYLRKNGLTDGKWAHLNTPTQGYTQVGIIHF